jgi:hypothetical protein
MNRASLDHAPQSSVAEASPSLEASDDFEMPPSSMRYCPSTLLGTFTLLMAGHGRCVNSSMMLGDREYAMWQLARAQTLPDEELRAVALRLFAYFDEPRTRINVFA